MESKIAATAQERQASRQQDRAGSPEDVPAAPEDVTRENEALYRSMFENNHAVMLLIDPDTAAIIDANPAACAYYGWSREELKKLRIDEINTLTPNEVAAQLRLARIERRRHFFFRHRRADGSIRNVEVYSGPVPLKGKNLLFSIIHDISDRVQAQKLLSESRRRLSTLMANLPGMAYSCLNDEHWTMKFVSQGCFELTGLPPEALLENRHQSYADLIHPEDRQAVRRRVQDGIERRVPFNLTYRIRSASGEEKWVMEKGQGVFEPSGALVALEGFITDITERRKAEEALRQSEEKFRLAFQTSPDAINLNRFADGMYIDINEGFTKLTGYTRQEAVGRTANELNIWANPRDGARLVEALTRNGFAENFEAVFRRKNGEDLIGLMSASLMVMNQEQVILSVTRDITDRKQAEKRLRETEKKFRELAESLPQVIFEVDPAGNLTYFNRAGFELFGYTPQDLARGFNVLDAIVAEDRERASRNIMRTLNGEHLEKAVYTAVKRDGTRLPVGINANRIIRAETPVGIRGLLFDLSPMQRAEEEKRKLEIQLQQAQKMEAIGTLAGGIAHDFNNILSVIMGNAELLMLSDISFSSCSELNQILNASQRAKQLVRQILAFSRQDEQQKLLIDLIPLVRETLDFLRASLPSTIELQHAVSQDAGAIQADPTQMQQVLINLSTNAAHAMEKNGGVLKIEFDSVTLTEEDVQIDPEAEPGAYVRLSVSDTGHGIDPGLLPRIFDPYFTTKGPDKGTGLGLAVVHGIVKSHGGLIKVYSEVGHGTVFHVFLPRADRAEKTEETPALQWARGAERVLLVDDEKPLVDMYQRMLGSLGYRVEGRTSPVEAVEAVRSNPKKYDLVITDMTMPQMTGYTLAKRLMQIHPGLPVILCSGFSDQVSEEKARAAGISAFLLKPVVLRDLASTLRAVLDHTSKQNTSHPL